MAEDKKIPSPEKLKALQLAMQKIDNEFGKGAILKLGDDKIEDVPVTPTGSVGLNVALGVGGYSRGRVV
jgi:recombination protein RecA